MADDFDKEMAEAIDEFKKRGSIPGGPKPVPPMSRREKRDIKEGWEMERLYQLRYDETEYRGEMLKLATQQNQGIWNICKAVCFFGVAICLILLNTR